MQKNQILQSATTLLSVGIIAMMIYLSVEQFAIHVAIGECIDSTYLLEECFDLFVL